MDTFICAIYPKFGALAGHKKKQDRGGTGNKIGTVPPESGQLATMYLKRAHAHTLWSLVTWGTEAWWHRSGSPPFKIQLAVGYTGSILSLIAVMPTGSFQEALNFPPA
jgi:hypothetical protein